MTGLLSTSCTCELDKSIATRLVIVLDADSGAHDRTELLEGFMKIPVRPINAETFHENVALRLTTSEELFVVGESPTDFTMKLRELDVVEQSTSLDYVREAAKGVVEVLESRPKNIMCSDLTF